MPTQKTRLNRLIAGICLASIALVLLATRVQPDANDNTDLSVAEGEKLLLFTQSADEHFTNTTLPQLSAWAAKEKIELVSMDIEQGVPKDITATPALVFLNDKGRTIYASRYTELSTIQNFIRTSRMRSQSAVPWCAEEVLQCKHGRAKLSAPLKITPIRGDFPAKAVENDFSYRAKAAFARGMLNFVEQSEACIQRTDRVFYCDIHPYVNESGELFLSLELFSMFNCIRSVYSTGERPLQGNFSTYESLFTQAGHLFQEQIQMAIRESVIGDAWTPLPEGVSTKNWEELGFPLPAQQQQNILTPSDLVLATSWGDAQAAIPGVPALFFRFPAPLDRYAGEIQDYTATVELHENGSLRAGNFTADLRSLSMGMVELDDKVKRKYIYTKRFPEASFSFTLPNIGAPLLPGHINRIPLAGTFVFMKKESPLLVQADLLPQLNVKGEPELFVQVQFELNITDDYGIAGPDGPEAASKTLIFDLNFIVSPT